MSKNKRVGLFFVVAFIGLLLTSALVVKDFTQRLGIQEQGRLGNLLSQYPEAELEIVAHFYSLPTEEAIAKGKELEEKYGYIAEKRPTDQYITSYYWRMLAFMASVWLVFFAALAWSFNQQRQQRQAYERLEQEYSEVNDFLLKTKNQLETEEQTTKELITDISHQLKTPLASLKMNYDILASDDYTTAEKEFFLQQGQGEFKKLALLLNSLLSLSHLETKMIQLKPTAQFIRPALTEAINLVYMKAYAKKIDIELNNFADVSVSFDKHWTQEVLRNLLDNAIKYAPQGSLITVRVKALVSHILIEVSDQGCGIPEHERTAIFQRFYRGAQQQEIEGTGVGLYLARKLVEEQEGTISVKNNLTGGASFKVTLPLAKKY